jgi:hypothetical protein
MNSDLPQETLEQFEQALENGVTIDELPIGLINNGIRWNGDGFNMPLPNSFLEN